MEQIDCGFPFGSMRLERWEGEPARPWFTPTQGHDGILLGEQAVPIRVLPLRFAVNALFYAVIIWALFAGPVALRRRRRVRRGLCPMCAYPAGASAVCTECGESRGASRGEPRRSTADGLMEAAGGPGGGSSR